MSLKTLQFKNIILNKKKIHKSKEPSDLLSVDLDQIVVSNLNIMAKALSILLVTYKVKFLNHYALFYLRWVTI